MISTKGRYALRVMIDLAAHAGEGPVPLKDIAERQGVSKKYLEIIVKDLVKGKFIKGASGKGGGYLLCRAPEDYSVGEIIELTSQLIGFGDADVHYQWQVDRNDGAGWVDAEDGNRWKYTFLADRFTVMYNWRLIVTVDE